MGAICGFVNLKNKPVSIEDLRTMSHLLHYRGPHHESYYFHHNVGIAFRTLKSETCYKEDIAETKDDGLFCVVDADINNLKDVFGNEDRIGLRTFGYLYKKYGTKFIEKLNGPFAIAILDNLRNTLILARDRSGQKPLYYTFSDGFFAFASELKALTSLPYIQKELDPKSLYWYLSSGYICSPRTIYRRIYKLPEGTILIFDLNKQLIKESVYNSQGSELDSTISEEVLIDKLDELLTTVVGEHVSKVPEPIGCFFSGGVDTSLILALLKKVTDKKIKTFTIGFEDPLCDERPYAKNIADYLDVENYEYVISEDDFINITQNIVALFDEPFADIGATTAFQAGRLAKKYTDTVFSGDGADFLFGNYDFKYLYLFYKTIPGFIRRPMILSLDFVFDSPLLKKKFPNMPIRGYLGEENFFEAFFIMWKKNELKRLLGFEVDTKEGKFYRVFTSSQGKALSNRILKAQYKTYGIDCVDTKSERANMAHSLHIINPYLDNRIIEFADSLPVRLKYKKGYGKYLNRKVLYRYIPREYFDRPKRGTGIPFGKLTDKGMKMFISKYLNPERLKREGIFEDIGVIEQAINSYMLGDYFSGPKLWTLIIFEIWLERNNYKKNE